MRMTVRSLKLMAAGRVKRRRRRQLLVAAAVTVKGLKSRQQQQQQQVRVFVVLRERGLRVRGVGVVAYSCLLCALLFSCSVKGSERGAGGLCSTPAASRPDTAVLL
jgi:hypothetical protein